MNKQWFARLREGTEYGRWVPTGCTDKDAAIDYIQTYYGNRVIEWLLW